MNPSHHPVLLPFTALILLIATCLIPTAVADNPSSNTVISLYPGWNCVSVPRVLADGSDTGAIFRNVNLANHSMWAYNGSVSCWVRVTDATRIRPLEGFWVYSLNRTDVPLTYRNDPIQVPPVRKLPAGWSIIGFTDRSPASARDTLITVQKSWTIAIPYNATRQSFETAMVNGGSGEQSEQRLMHPMQGYWVYMNQKGDLAAMGV